MARRQGSTNIFYKYQLFHRSDPKSDWEECGYHQTLASMAKETAYSAPCISAVPNGQPLNFKRSGGSRELSKSPRSHSK